MSMQGNKSAVSEPKEEQVRWVINWANNKYKKYDVKDGVEYFLNCVSQPISVSYCTNKLLLILKVKL